MKEFFIFLNFSFISATFGPLETVTPFTPSLRPWRFLVKKENYREQILNKIGYKRVSKKQKIFSKKDIIYRPPLSRE
jgi:hypothetical protein